MGAVRRFYHALLPWRRLTALQDRNKVMLTMDDLSLALGEHGINVKKPDYCRSPSRHDPHVF